MFRPIEAIFRLLQFCSKSVIHIYIYTYVCVYDVSAYGGHLQVIKILFKECHIYTHMFVCIYTYIYDAL